MISVVRTKLPSRFHCLVSSHSLHYSHVTFTWMDGIIPLFFKRFPNLCTYSIWIHFYYHATSDTVFRDTKKPADILCTTYAHVNHFYGCLARECSINILKVNQITPHGIDFRTRHFHKVTTKVAFNLKRRCPHLAVILIHAVNREQILAEYTMSPINASYSLPESQLYYLGQPKIPTVRKSLWGT